MSELTIGPLQDRIITRLKSGYLGTKRLAREVYGLRREEEPTRSQRESVRQALRSLEQEEFVRLTKYIWDRERCWELTGKTIPIPEKKKAAPRKPLAVVK